MIFTATNTSLGILILFLKQCHLFWFPKSIKYKALMFTQVDHIRDRSYNANYMPIT